VAVRIQVSNLFAITDTSGIGRRNLDLNRQSREPKFLAIDDMRPLIAKLLMPAILTAAGVFLAVAPPIRPAGVALCSVIALQGIVQFIVVGLVNPTQECLLYKRFFEWRRIEYADIVKCGRPIFPLFWGLHYLRLRNFEPPLGKLYFVQYHPAPLFSQHELDQEVIEQIRARIAGKSFPAQASPSSSKSTLQASSAQLGIKACAISALLSALTVLFLRVLLSWPGPNFPPKIAPGQGVIYSIFVYLSLFCARLVDWPYNGVAILGLLVGIALLRFRGHAAFLSLALGAILGGIVARWFD